MLTAAAEECVRGRLSQPQMDVAGVDHDAVGAVGVVCLRAQDSRCVITPHQQVISVRRLSGFDLQPPLPLVILLLLFLLQRFSEAETHTQSAVASLWRVYL